MNVVTRDEFMESIKTVLKPGVENAVSLEFLCSYYGANERVIRSFLHYARVNGIPVLSSTKYGGYYLPKDQHEAQEFIRAQTNRAKACFASLKAAIADEDLKFFRDVAEMRYTQNLVTLTPQVVLSGVQISEKVDIDEVVSRIETKLEDEFVAAAEGVYS